MDFIIRLLPAQGTRETNYLVIINQFCKGVIFKLVSNMLAEETTNTFIKQFYQLHGLPLAIISD